MDKSIIVNSFYTVIFIYIDILNVFTGKGIRDKIYQKCLPFDIPVK